MQKLLSLILIICIFCAFNYCRQPLFYDGEGWYSVCLGEGSSGKIEGFSTSEIEDYYLYKNIRGQSLTTKDKRYIDDFLKRYDCKLLFIEEVEGVVTKYYYSPKISVYKPVNGKKVNVQTAVSEEIFTIGSPLIYGGY